ncbi:Acetolactate synthase [Rubellimicrobium mesophilum DSM 19309]|uniref:Acetolactate synthase n=2 Tax=Rubellimicrobium TaxID=295418 RepID=A0A017HV63_9RHOB|nr:Acetolactate synthase [Rubellimicrobium mesophilum DSM 19309]
MALGVGGPLAAQEFQLPSGHAATLFDVVLEEAGDVMAPDAGTDPEALPEGELDESEPLDQPPPDNPDAAEDPEAAADAGEGGAATGGLARFRLVVPGLGGEGAAYEDVAQDFAWLCESLALPALDANGWSPTEVVIALSDREVPFGEADPEAVQFFEGFRIADGACIAQAF